MFTESSSRRSFFVAVINSLGALITAAVAIPAGIYLLAKPKSAQGSDWEAVADLAQLPIGKPQEVLYNRKRVDGWRKVVEKASTWIVRTDQNNVVAFLPSCTHLGCAYHWDESMGDFVCPCHASVFSIDGKVLAGPAPRPLDRYCSKIESGKVLIGSQIEKGINT